MTKLKQHAAKITLITLSFCAGIGISEFLTRMLAPEFGAGQQLPVQILERYSLKTRPPSTEFRQRSNSGEFNVSYKTNEIGFRDIPHTKPVPKNTIVFIGDSFTEGYGVKQSKRYPEYTRSLNKPVVVSAIAGYNIRDYINVLAYLKDQGKLGETIIIGLCVENDIIDYETTQSDKDQSSQFVPVLKSWLNQNSYLFNLLASFARSNNLLNETAISLGLAAGPNGQSTTKFGQREIDASTKLLSRSLSFGKTVIVLIIPDRRVWSDKVETSKQALERQGMLKKTLKQNGFLLVDPTNEFTNKSDNPLSEYHFSIDGHWNQLGHRVAGHMITKKLLDLSQISD